MEPEMTSVSSEPVVPVEPVETTESTIESTETPSEPVVTEEPTPELFALPDGREVDGATLAREWKENFLPDYTRKSQELSKYKNINSDFSNKSETPVNPWEDPNWEPSSWQEALEMAEKRIEWKQQQELAAQKQHEAQLSQEIDAQVQQVQAMDKNVNMDKVFLHATKYGFRDLVMAYKNMQDSVSMVKTAQEMAARNIQKRANEPIATGTGNMTPETGVAYTPGQYGSALEYYRSLSK